MNLTQPTTEKRKSKSFWNRLLHLPRKSQLKEKHEDSFTRQSMMYSSLNTTKQEVLVCNSSRSTSDESENFTTLESSAFMNVHKHAGILFLNKDSATSCFAPKEENRHVQFAPTPMNKYYKVDIKSAPSARQNDENKENLEQTKSVKPTRPILRLGKGQKLTFQSSSEDTQSNIETRLVNVTYIDGPEISTANDTPSMARTSTKLALVDRKNGSLQQLNVSSIHKYNSLPRNQKIVGESVSTQDQPQVTSQSSDANRIEYISAQQKRNIYLAQDIDRYRRSVRSLNSHRQSCYGVSDPSRLFEGKKVLQEQYNVSNQDLRHRSSLGGPLVHSSQMVNNSNNSSGNFTQKSHSNPETQMNMKRFVKVPIPTRGSGSVRSLDQPMQSAHKHSYLSETNSNNLTRKHQHCSTGHIPNKAINEVGLPLVANKRNNQTSSGNSKSRSKSPQYIPLCETFTSNKIASKNKGNSLPQNKYLNPQQNTSDKTFLQKQKWTCAGASLEGKNKKSKCNSAEHYGEQNAYISETRKQAIKSAIYTQKRKMVNKICKYKSKACEDGFSSMADDECSFNCSCPSCVIKLSRSYKRSGFKSLFSLNKDNKYFFTIEPDIVEGNETERLPENQTCKGSMAKAQPHLSKKHNNELPSNKTWYECDDTLCETPNKKKSSEKPAVEALTRELIKTPPNKLVDNIYENITQIINSATNRNLKPQDVKMIFSTPISSPMKLGVMTKSLTKPRVLFPNEHNERQKTLDQSLKQILTPVKNSDCFNDSIVLLQEIFQKLSQECKELLQPDVTSNISDDQMSDITNQNTPSNRYVNDLVKNLKSAELSEADFANIIGGIAHNIFTETKAKRKVKPLKHSTSLPDVKKASLVDKAMSVANSLRNLCDLQMKTYNTSQSVACRNTNKTETELALSGDSVLGNRQLPDGWSRTPTTENSSESNDAKSTKLSSSGTSKDSSKYSENELQLLENAIRLGMGLSPVNKVKKAPVYASSPTKATKYKSRDVLSGKGKLKLKIYYNSGLVTVFVMKAAKLSWTASRDLNSYVKITMVPDEFKRVHWRTAVQKAQIDPVFNQKFSFELLQEDETKRLVFSVWHRDYSKQRSELIGCMSFSVRHVMDNSHNVDGWYRLLREKFGTQKHFAAHTRKNSCSLQGPVN